MRRQSSTATLLMIKRFWIFKLKFHPLVECNFAGKHADGDRSSTSASLSRALPLRVFFEICTKRRSLVRLRTVGRGSVMAQPERAWIFRG
jgi:hypothetical protein